MRRQRCSSISASVPSSVSSIMSATRRGASADARTPYITSVGGAFCDARGGARLASRWVIVGANKTPSCGAAASPPYALAWFRPPPFHLPLRARGTILRGHPFLLFLLLLLFGWAWPPVVAFRGASTTTTAGRFRTASTRVQARTASVFQNRQSPQAQGEMQVRA